MTDKIFPVTNSPLETPTTSTPKMAVLEQLLLLMVVYRA